METLHRALDVGVVAVNIRRRDGQGRVTLEVVRALANRGHRVTAYSATLSEDLAKMPSVRWVRVKQRPGPALVFYPLFVLEATLALRRRKHDVVFLMGACALPSDPVAFYAAFTEVGWRGAGGGSGSGWLNRRLYSRLALLIERLVSRRISSLMPISDQVADEMRPLIRSDVPVKVIPGGVDLDDFVVVSDESRVLARKELGIPNDEYAIVLIGEFATGRKGLDALARAVSMSKDPSERIYLHGDGPKEKTMLKMRFIGAENRVRFLESQIPVPTVLAAADVVAIPSLYEPFSLVALEAAASGIPVVISNRAGAASLLEGAVRSVDPSDVTGIRDAIDSVRSDGSLGKESALKARAIAERFTWDHIASMAVEVIEQLGNDGGDYR